VITLRRSKERRHERRLTQEVWQTFDPEHQGQPFGDRFGSLEILSEERFPPDEGIPRRLHADAEIITYVREGTLAHEDSMGRSGLIHAGKFQRMTAGSGIQRSETNASKTEWAHVFQIWFRPSEKHLSPSLEREHFSVADRRGGLRVVASPDARRGSLRIHQDALLYSGFLAPGQHMVHAFEPKRSAWLHVVMGEVTLGDIVLVTGDGAGATDERSLSFTVRENTEVLLIDVAENVPSSNTNGSKP